MARGVADYGRYDDDPDHVGCPWAKSDMSPCVARDGRLALGGDPPRQCAGCGNYVAFLIRDLTSEYEPARGYAMTGLPAADADTFRRLVWEATKPQEVSDDSPGRTSDAPGPQA